MKTVIIGFSGSGKSTLAKAIGEKQGAPVLYLDKVHWLPGWKERDREDELKIVGDFLDNNESWVIDGNYNSLYFERRCEEADRIIFMDFNRFLCLSRAMKRKREYNGKTRFSITDGCPEKIDREFLMWLLFKGRTKKRRGRFVEAVRKFSEKSVVLKNQKELDRFYALISSEG